MSKLNDLIKMVDDSVHELYFACTELDVRDEEKAFDKYEAALANIVEYSKATEK